jgi:hypothetical protein
MAYLSISQAGLFPDGYFGFQGDGLIAALQGRDEVKENFFRRQTFSFPRRGSFGSFDYQVKAAAHLLAFFEFGAADKFRREAFPD